MILKWSLGNFGWSYDELTVILQWCYDVLTIILRWLKNDPMLIRWYYYNYFEMISWKSHNDLMMSLLWFYTLKLFFSTFPVLSHHCYRAGQSRMEGSTCCPRCWPPLVDQVSIYQTFVSSSLTSISKSVCPRQSCSALSNYGRGVRSPPKRGDEGHSIRVA